MPLMVGLAAVAAAARGDVHRADAYFRELLVRFEHEPPAYSALSTSAVAAGRLDEAMEFAIRSADAHELLSKFALYMPWFEPLQAHPRFGELRERLRLWGTE